MRRLAVTRVVRFAVGLLFWVTLGPVLSGASAAADLDPMFRMRSLFSEIDVGLSGWAGYPLDGQIRYRILPALVANVGYRF